MTETCDDLNYILTTKLYLKNYFTCDWTLTTILEKKQTLFQEFWKSVTKAEKKPILNK